MTPRQKAIRTALQILAGGVVLAGPLVAALPISAATMAVIVAVLLFAGGLVALVQNTLEDNGILPKLFKNEGGQSTWVVVVVVVLLLAILLVVTGHLHF